jgi:hypothetical protein
MSVPKSRLKISLIEHGMGGVLEGDAISALNITNESNLISTKLPIGSSQFTVFGDFLPLKIGQPLKIFFDGVQIASRFVSKPRRIDGKKWNIYAEDEMGLLDRSYFFGGIYDDAMAIDIISSIFEGTNISYSISNSLASETVSGYIPYCSKREALKQVCFAICATVTCLPNYVYIDKIEEKEPKSIVPERIYEGIREKDEDFVGKINISSHSYKKSDEAIVVYDAKNGGTISEKVVLFGEPLWDLSITNGEILESGANYAVITIYDDGVLTGKRYKHETSTMVRKRLSEYGQEEKEVSITGATLVSRKNIDKVLDFCYNYIGRGKTISAKIAERKTFYYRKYGEAKYGDGYRYYKRNESIDVMDEIKLLYMDGTSETGRVVKQTFAVVGGILAKNNDIYISRS